MSLRASAIVFGVLWTGGMLWWSARSTFRRSSFGPLPALPPHSPGMADGLVAEKPSEMSRGSRLFEFRRHPCSSDTAKLLALA